MHIGMVTDTFLPRINGVTKSTLTFAEHFRRLGHRVTIFAPRYPGAQEENPEVLRFPSYYLFFSPEDRLGNTLSPTARRLFKKLPELKLDIIHTQTPFALGIAMARQARRLGLASLHTYHTLFEAYMPHYFKLLPRSLDKPIVASFSRWFCDQHDQVIVPSSAIAEMLAGYRLRAPIKILPTGTDLSPFQNLDGKRMREKLGFGPEDKMLLSMGRVAHEKNIPFLFDVLERLQAKQPRARLVVAGQGPALESVKAESEKRRLGERVVFLGLLNRRDWADLYAAADLHLLASVTETQGLVLTESMAAGTPCVAVAAMGVRDVMQGGGGLAVSLNLEEFTAAVLRLLEDKQLYAAKVEECSRQAHAWSAETKAQEMLDNYAQLIAAKRKAA
ncbi:MAG: glycosyltransferase [candidate division FCPU426 bacterium]